ncbi:hypothetical protein R75461_07379 [Paraburkholderia nemoris]|nr:hypothetical protein R75461_07379 [Paraburkholderia nemoris]
MGTQVETRLKRRRFSENCRKRTQKPVRLVSAPLRLLALHTSGFSKFAGNKGAKGIGDIRKGQDVRLCYLGRSKHLTFNRPEQVHGNPLTSEKGRIAWKLRTLFEWHPQLFHVLAEHRHGRPVAAPDKIERQPRRTTPQLGSDAEGSSFDSKRPSDSFTAALGNARRGHLRNTPAGDLPRSR